MPPSRTSLNLQMSIGTLLGVAGDIRGHLQRSPLKMKAAMNHKTGDVPLIDWYGPDEDAHMIIWGRTVASVRHLAGPRRGYLRSIRFTLALAAASPPSIMNFRLEKTTDALGAKKTNDY